MEREGKRKMKRWLLPFWSRMDDIGTPLTRSQSPVEKMVILAMLASIAALLQSMGGFLPGIGYLFSLLSTGPIFIATWMAPKRGLLTYLLTLVLLWIIQPSELFIYPFTTGLLGVVLGWTLRRYKRKIMIIVLSGLSLTFGIDLVLAVLQFPLLGPVADTSFNLKTTVFLFVFSFFYSWIWFEGLKYLIRHYFRARSNINR